MKKTRLDLYLSGNGMSRSREKARKEILAGWVRVNGETVHDPSKGVTGEETITVERPGGEFVSRGGEKLAHALEVFGITVTGRVVADLGASTGGFTHCMLVNGARKVYAIDVGYGQFDFTLRSDPRVVVRERTNVRHLTAADFDEKPDFVTADLSFISILKVFPVIRDIFSPADGVILVKPQFEAGPGEHKKGVVRKPDVHRSILERVISALVADGLIFRGLAPSPITGPAGNIEFLLYFSVGKGEDKEEIRHDLGAIVEKVVNEAHEIHNGSETDSNG